MKMITDENRDAFRAALRAFLEPYGAGHYDLLDVVRQEANAYQKMHEKMQEAIEARNLAERHANDLTNPTQAIIDVLRSINDKLRVANEMTEARLEYAARNRPREPGR